MAETNFSAFIGSAADLLRGDFKRGRHFYFFSPPRPFAEIDADLKVVTDQIRGMLEELSK